MTTLTINDESAIGTILYVQDISDALIITPFTLYSKY